MSHNLPQLAIPYLKRDFLRVVDRVANRRIAFSIVNRRGKPVVRIVPVRPSGFGCMAGTAEIVGDIINPIDDLGWTGDEENVCSSADL